ncbi:hypothetical protein JW813_05270 [Clostridium botulinum]|uniref:hypothetical protein n=1 Tax=Clostridium botulinum TaxID=1491 RepID=UPI0022482E72|nr:hypothetical protein [Clostridium botulinum]UZP04419.1 hypothetical protein JW813_05270 [Clostridium botulinum]UZP07831.1 hypothetical protein JYA71_05545 [Clostridium botulinum]UZP11158.1 hypothetical protein JYA74_05265 [Clostridium botulinum]
MVNIKIDLKRIKNEMIKKGLRQKDLVNMINLKYGNNSTHKVYISEFLSSKKRSYKTCFFICDALDLKLNEVYKYEKE